MLGVPGTTQAHSKTKDILGNRPIGGLPHTRPSFKQVLRLFEARLVGADTLPGMQGRGRPNGVHQAWVALNDSLPRLQEGKLNFMATQNKSEDKAPAPTKPVKEAAAQDLTDQVVPTPESSAPPSRAVIDKAPKEEVGPVPTPGSWVVIDRSIVPPFTITTLAMPVSDIGVVVNVVTQTETTIANSCSFLAGTRIDKSNGPPRVIRW